jgi:hypothetical protein
MVRIEGEVLVDRPGEEVFDFVADERNEPLYNPRMRHAEKLTPGPVGPGTRFRAEFASPGRPVATSEITLYERPRRLASSTSMSMMDVRGTLSFEEVPGGTRLRWSWQLEPRGFWKLAGPLIARVGRRQEQATWTGLKRFLEARGDSSSASS